MQTNMEYRHYLMNNADNIIKHNQIVANTNCTNTPNLLNDFKYQNNPLFLDSIKITSYNDNNNSDLKQNYLNNVYIKSNMYTPIIKYK